MRKKQLFLIATTLLCTLILSSSLTLAASGQKIKVPYVISANGWWTGIAITNDDATPITDMKLLFTTSDGDTGWTPELAPPPQSERKGFLIPYSTDIEEIAGYAIVINTVSALYTGEGTKTLPSDAGSVSFYHSGTQEFSVTVYIGNATGFAFQVFHSTEVNP